MALWVLGQPPSGFRQVGFPTQVQHVWGLCGALHSCELMPLGLDISILCSFHCCSQVPLTSWMCAVLYLIVKRPAKSNWQYWWAPEAARTLPAPLSLSDRSSSSCRNMGQHMWRGARAACCLMARAVEAWRAVQGQLGLHCTGCFSHDLGVHRRAAWHHQRRLIVQLLPGAALCKATGG